MSDREDDRFRPKLGPPRARGGGTKSKFVSSVIQHAARTGRALPKSLSKRALKPRSKHFGRGQVAARLAGQSLGPRARRATVKVRFVPLASVSPRATEQHARYMARDSAAREGEQGRTYDALNDEVDPAEFTERTQSDRHHFRIIISPEDGAALGDLKSYARDLMSQVERDLGTRLEWIGADHWDTDDPHVHILLRGKDETGRDLVISPEYISQGMRHRAAEIATQWLGPRTELEIRESQTREVTLERWTGLDRSIVSQLDQGRIIMRGSASTADSRFRSGLLIGRLDHLTKLGLASKIQAFTYEVTPKLESVLRRLGERGDIIRTLQRAIYGQRRGYALLDDVSVGSRVIGKIATRGLVEEQSDRGYLAIDATDGRAYYAKLPANADFNDYPVGGIIEIRRGAEPRRVDANILAISEQGIYRPDRHLQLARSQLKSGNDPEAYVQSHVRRLEALRRAGITDRLDNGDWRIPPDFAARAQAYDAQRSQGVTFDLRSHLPIDRQIKAIGMTWLDQQLAGNPESLATSGFGSEARLALNQRTDVLIERGLAERRETRVMYARNLLDTLRRRDLEEAARRITTETGLIHRPTSDGERISGTYRRSIFLTSGRFAMLDDATGFSLVPWRPVIESRIGQPIIAVVTRNFTTFDFSRTRELSL